MATAILPQAHHLPERNPGIPFDPSAVESALINRSAVERRAATLPARRTVKKEWQAAWLLHAIRTIDLTTLSGDDTPGTVRRLCAKARQPVRTGLLQALGVAHIPLSTGAVCVYHEMVPTAVECSECGEVLQVVSVQPLKLYYALDLEEEPLLEEEHRLPKSG